jgi:hypothetical protein
MNAKHGWRAIDPDNAIPLPVTVGMEIDSRAPAKAFNGVLPADFPKDSLRYGLSCLRDCHLPPPWLRMNAASSFRLTKAARPIL